MAYLLDTNAISEIFRKAPNPEFLDWLNQIPPSEQFIASIVLGELYKGAFLHPNSDSLLTRVSERVLPTFGILPFDEICALKFGQLYAHLKNRGQGIGLLDTQIAATALAYGLTVVTANVRHFQRVPELKLRSFRPGMTA